MSKGKDNMILRPDEMIGIIDLRSLGYYKIKQGILQQNLSRCYRFEKEEKLCEYFNKFVNTGGSHLSHTVVKPDSCLAQIFCCQLILYN